MPSCSTSRCRRPHDWAHFNHYHRHWLTALHDCKAPVSTGLSSRFCDREARRACPPIVKPFATRLSSPIPRCRARIVTSLQRTSLWPAWIAVRYASVFGSWPRTRWTLHCRPHCINKRSFSDPSCRNAGVSGYSTSCVWSEFIADAAGCHHNRLETLEQRQSQPARHLGPAPQDQRHRGPSVKCYNCDRPAARSHSTLLPSAAPISAGKPADTSSLSPAAAFLWTWAHPQVDPTCRLVGILFVFPLIKVHKLLVRRGADNRIYNNKTAGRVGAANQACAGEASPQHRPMVSWACAS